jgi:uncharacterized DUF497 family protein
MIQIIQIRNNGIIAIGFSEKARALIVVHCENPSGTEIRIISARKATKTERSTVFGGKI